jgi:predicted phosphodiesterase
LHPLIGLLADAHGNGTAFNRGVALLLARGAQQLYFLGDAIGYIPSIDVLDSIAGLGGRIRCILGNHEAMLLAGKVEGARDEVYQLQASRALMTREHLQMIASWPSSRRETFAGEEVLMVHGSPSDPTYGYVYPDTDLSGQRQNASWIVMANTHYPFVRHYAGTCYVNVGSCGLPRDDGRYGSVALLDVQRRHVQLLRFDITSDTRQTLKRCSTVHPLVLSVFERRRPDITGEVL